MISRISGVIWDMGDGYVVIRAGGVGYQVHVPSDVLDGIRGMDQPVDLFTHFYVRENRLALYGFLTKEKRALFELLLDISGVGPSVALSVLSTVSPDALRQAVLQDQPGLLTRVPGIGSKTASKIIFHLRDKVVSSDGEAAPLLTDADSEVLAALTGLGFSLVEAQTALQNLPSAEDLPVAERIRLALSSLG